MCDAEKTLPHMIQKAKNAGTKKGRNIEIGEKKLRETHSIPR